MELISYTFSLFIQAFKGAFLHYDHKLWGSGPAPAHPGKDSSLETGDKYQATLAKVSDDTHVLMGNTFRTKPVSIQANLRALCSAQDLILFPWKEFFSMTAYIHIITVLIFVLTYSLVEFR